MFFYSEKKVDGTSTFLSFLRSLSYLSNMNIDMLIILMKEIEHGSDCQIQDSINIYYLIDR